ncbi:SulP family inorganic anion transporter [Vagococcus fluvialis]|uniref:SulP family inorganic anion transporter n=1 Tax=Vagococcus fluvialis TaxID=2738 RepID=UPI001D0A99F4|nr:SulP family inorganic anion transporter [Vagococcus fluvialis]UDM74598.1 SulP family inorganic anion transporter [Vagococcus fluvialis]
MLLSLRKDEWFGNIKNDMLGGIVTAIALIPEVIGFAIIAGINPITALFASVSTSIVTSFTSGRPGMVSAAAGSMALIMVSIIKDHGIEYMIAATILTGVIQLILGYLGIHKLMKFISKPVMLGFVNALAILIFMAQIQQLVNVTTITYVVVGGSILLMFFLPKIFKSIPPALIVIILTTIISMFSSITLQTVGDLGDITGSLPTFSIPTIPFTIETSLIILPVSLGLTMVGLIESLLTLPLVDDMTNTQGNSHREVKSQGLANIFTGFLGGPAGCAMIGQSVINVKSGGKKRLSTLIAGLSLLLLIVFFKEIMIQIPTAALIGIMITVSFETFDWKSIKNIKQTDISDIIIMMTTILIVVYTHNLAIGIFVGVFLNIILFTIEISKLTITQTEATLEIKGLLFFISSNYLTEYFNKIDLETINKIDFTDLKVFDETSKSVLDDVIKKIEQKKSTILITK